jgi:hypothetical protein
MAGCRGARDATVLLERDLRLQEDKIYQLQACLDDACAAREATIRENEALKAELSGGDRGAGSDTSPSTTPPSVELPDSKESTPDLTPPTIELPGNADPPSVEPTPGGKQTVIEARSTATGTAATRASWWCSSRATRRATWSSGQAPFRWW